MTPAVLRSFLISIGYKVNGAEEKRFTDGLTAATLKANLLSEAIIELAKKVVKSVADMASGFEQMYYMSARTGASVQNIKSLAYSVGQLGGSYSQALGSIETFGRRMRENPGYKELVKSLGVATEINGKTRDTTAIFEDLGTALSRKDYYVGLQYAETLGIDEKTFSILRSQPEALRRYRQEYERTAKMFGVDGRQASEDSKELMQSLRSLEAVFTALGEKLLTSVVPALTRVIDKFREWINSNPEKINAVLRAGEMAILAFFHALERLGSIFAPVIEGIGKLAESITGDEGLQGKLDTFATWLLAVWVVKVLAGFAGVSRGWAALLLKFGIGGAIGLAASGGGHMTPDQYRDSLQADPGRAAADAELNKNGGALKRWWQRTMPSWLGGGGGSSGGDPSAGADAGPSRPLGKISQNANAQTIIKTLRAAGYSDNAIAAVVGSMQTESTFNPRARNEIAGGHTGLWQWDQHRWPRIKKWIQDRGGDPYDAEWQTKAWVAEHDAKPGDPMYDHRRTERGGKILRNSPTLEEAIHGVRESERFGAGEEGGRAAHARRWLPHVTQAPEPPKTPPPEPQVSEPRPSAVLPAPKPPDPAKPGITLDQFNERFGPALGNMRSSGTPKSEALSSSSAVNNSRNVTLHQKTEVNVMGTSDPNSTANAVGSAQNKVNRMSIQNAYGTLR